MSLTERSTLFIAYTPWIFPPFFRRPAAAFFFTIVNHASSRIARARQRVSELARPRRGASLVPLPLSFAPRAAARSRLASLCILVTTLGSEKMAARMDAEIERTETVK